MSLCLIDVHGDIEGDFEWVIDLPRNATRKQVHELIFGINPPELDSPLCSCSIQKGCENCKHKDDMNCDVNWWNAPYIPKRRGLSFCPK